MQAVVKKVVYRFRYRLGPGQVGEEVFHIVLIEKKKHEQQRFLFSLFFELFFHNSPDQQIVVKDFLQIWIHSEHF